jgi:hypothetical protein
MHVLSEEMVDGLPMLLQLAFGCFFSVAAAIIPTTCLRLATYSRTRDVMLSCLLPFELVYGNCTLSYKPTQIGTSPVYEFSVLAFR